MEKKNVHIREKSNHNLFNTIGFIGGGRITRIILGGFKNSGRINECNCTVSDKQPEVLENLKKQYKEITITDDNKQSALSDIVFLAVHPPAIEEVANEVKYCLPQDKILISLAPRFTIARLSGLLNGFNKIVRMIPNAPSIINSGYNPVHFSSVFTQTEKKELLEIFSILGESPEVEEEKLEAYAVLTAMGPTYFWFQLYELHCIAKSFGLSEKESEEGIIKTVCGAVKTIYKSGLSPSSVMDLIPVKPLGHQEENIRNIYNDCLKTVFKKLKGEKQC
ncbi:MAG: NAD(P)-binding domain-containing protein [Candidatus Omnitrophica bacterium]|nr:NAD(P)-binding domain-containing protein [Candidatus Omnitrophota bacterium]